MYPRTSSSPARRKNIYKVIYYTLVNNDAVSTGGVASVEPEEEVDIKSEWLRVTDRLTAGYSTGRFVETELNASNTISYNGHQKNSRKPTC
jgi:hypothetical protein